MSHKLVSARALTLTVSAETQFHVSTSHPAPSTATAEAPKFDLHDKVALITGAARGIGRGCALALAASGADIVLGLRDINQDNGTIEAVRTTGRRVLPVQLDITDRV